MDDTSRKQKGGFGHLSIYKRKAQEPKNLNSNGPDFFPTHA